jgi:hypothetical protein
VLCLIVVPLPPGRNPFPVKINNNNKKVKFFFDLLGLNRYFLHFAIKITSAFLVPPSDVQEPVYVSRSKD